MREISISKAMNEALREEMTRDGGVFVVGEDIGHYGGTFNVTRDLLKEFGPRRIVSTGVSENAIIGLAVGAALAGMRPIAEIMFCDFLLCGIDQTINYAAATTYAGGGNVRVPLVVRTTTGYHGGPVHSKHLEAWIAHVPGFKVVFPTTPYDAKGLLKSAIREDNPVMIFESRHLYEVTGPVPEEDYIVEIGPAAVRCDGKDLTVATYGLCVGLALEAAKELSTHDIEIEVVDLRTLSPIDVETILTSVTKTGRLLIVHDGWQNCGLGAEIATQVYRRAFGNLKRPIERLTHLDVPHPYSHALADVVRPTREKIVAAATEMMQENSDEASTSAS